LSSEQPQGAAVGLARAGARPQHGVEQQVAGQDGLVDVGAKGQRRRRRRSGRLVQVLAGQVNDRRAVELHRVAVEAGGGEEPRDLVGIWHARQRDLHDQGEVTAGRGEHQQLALVDRPLLGARTRDGQATPPDVAPADDPGQQRLGRSQVAGEPAEVGGGVQRRARPVGVDVVGERVRGDDAGELPTVDVVAAVPVDRRVAALPLVHVSPWLARRDAPD
jgi:hypothetical protein